MKICVAFITTITIQSRHELYISWDDPNIITEMNPQKDSTSNKGLLTKPLLIGFLTFALLASICAYLAYQRYTIVRNEERENAQNMAESVRSRLQQALQYSLSATQAMTLLIDKQGIPANFDSIAPYIFKAHKYIDALELVPEGVIIFSRTPPGIKKPTKR